MQTYCLKCKKDTDNVISKKVTIKVNIEKTRCAICWSNKLRFLKQKPNKKLIKILILNLPYTKHYKTCWHIAQSAKKIRKI